MSQVHSQTLPPTRQLSEDGLPKVSVGDLRLHSVPMLVEIARSTPVSVLARGGAMPSLAHEALAVRLRERPELLSLLLSTLHKPTPTEPLAVNDSALRLVKPIEIRPDLVLANGDEGPWVLVEIQNEPDPVKKRKWPLAAAMMQDARGEMGDIVVITSSRTTALWAESASFSRGQLGSILDLRPTVVLLSDALARGEARGEAQALLAVLTTRGLIPDEAARTRITSCTDKVLLERWIVRAVTASSLNDVFGEP